MFSSVWENVCPTIPNPLTIGQRSLTAIAPTVSLANFLDVLGSEDRVQAVHKSRESATSGRPILELFCCLVPISGWSVGTGGRSEEKAKTGKYNI